MTTFRSRTEYLDNLYVSTFRMARKMLIDSIFSIHNSAFWYMLKQRNGMEPMVGGEYIPYKLEYSKNDRIHWLDKGGTVTLQDFEFMDEARFKWYRAAKEILRFWAEDQQNAGEAQMINLVQAKISNSIRAFPEDMDSQLTGANDESGSVTANAPPGIQHLISTDGTGTVGEINASTYTWWKNQFIDYDSGTTYVATANTPLASDFLNTGLDAMMEMKKKCRNKTKLIVTTWEMFKIMRNDLLSYFHWTGDPKYKDLGKLTMVLDFEGIPVVWSDNIPAGYMYFLDTDTFKFIYDPRYFFTMDPWLPIALQPGDKVSYIRLACSFVVKDRRSQGVIHGLPTSSTS